MTRRIAEFDIWRPSYANAIVSVYIAGTSTLAPLYLDEDLTIEAENPQTLQSMEAEGGVRYGKFERPVYTDHSYFLSINNNENTGVIKPAFSTLDKEDASEATVRAEGSDFDVSLEDIISQEVNVVNFGEFIEGEGGVPETNTNSMELAIAAISDGGFVNVPAGLYKLNSFDVPQNVIIIGQGIDATKIECVNGSSAFNIVGKNAGFENITLDGKLLSTNSIGIKSVGNDQVILNDVLIKRFETGATFLGGRSHNWNNLSVENTNNAIQLYGDNDAGDTTNGGAFEDLVWNGGVISFAAIRGVDFSFEDNLCQNITLIGVGYENCQGFATYVNGAQNIRHSSCWWVDNVETISIQDDEDPLTPDVQQNNDAINITFDSGRIDGGVFEATGTVQNVVLEDMKIFNIEFRMTLPIAGFVSLQDSLENAGVTITGESTKLIRSTTSLNGASFGLTTTNNPTKAWGINLNPGQHVYLEAKVIGRGRSNDEHAIYHLVTGAYRPGSELTYDTQTANFTVGDVITGLSSGATARIQDDIDTGATGTLTLIDIVGEFLNNEIITDSGGGSAVVNGSITDQPAILDAIGSELVRTSFETVAAFGVGFQANNSEIELNVIGDTGLTMEWAVNVDVVST